MSKDEILHFDSGLEIISTEEADLVTPQWLSEALLVGKYWLETGLVEKLHRQVRVERPRMGTYEVCDFVLLLLAYSVSGEKTLADFFSALKPVQHLLMAVWNRNKTPVASTLSRFLAAIEDSSLEQLRNLFETDLWERGLNTDNMGGLIDRRGEKYYFFDLDGTKQTARQRKLISNEEYPQAKRRSDKACGKGYTGRKRGDCLRTRSTIAQSHTSEWLGTFGSVGNGTAGKDLERACTLVQRYLKQHQKKGDQAIIRLDGYYGLPAFVNQIQHHQLGYILRGRDYGLLEHGSVQALLKATTPELWPYPEGDQMREIFDLGFLEGSWTGYTGKIRLIVVRTPYNPKHKHRIGKRKADFIYELFISSHSEAGLTGSDILSLYYGRGGFEKLLADEDVEQNYDRWCSWHPQGQEFCQILGQWVWNWRLRAGLAHQTQPLRQTVWSSAKESLTPTPKLSISSDTSTESSVDDAEYAPPQVAKGWAKSLNKFSGKDFTLLDEKTLQCPASLNMSPGEVRHNRYGDELILFGMKPKFCQQCSLKSNCLADSSKGIGGRRITVIRKKLSQPAKPISLPSASRAIAQPFLNYPNLPVIWLDFPTTRLRRDLTHELRKQKIFFELIIKTASIAISSTQYITREQRSHQRLSWFQRREKNSLQNTNSYWQVKLSGFSAKIFDWLYNSGLSSIVTL